MQLFLKLFINLLISLFSLNSYMYVFQRSLYFFLCEVDDLLIYSKRVVRKI